MKTQKQLDKIRKQMDSYIKYLWYTRLNLTSPTYTIYDDGTIDIHVAVHLKLPYHVKKLPFKIKSAESDLIIDSTQLTTLEGMPKRVDGNFEIRFNEKITSLAFCPKKIQGNFDCLLRNITSLNNAPDLVKGNAKIHTKEGLTVDYTGFIDGNLYIGSIYVNIVNMPTVKGSVKMSDPDYKSKIRKSVLNAIINSTTLQQKTNP